MMSKKSAMWVMMPLTLAAAGIPPGAEIWPEASAAHRDCPTQVERFLKPEPKPGERGMKLTSRASNPVPALNQFVSENHRWPIASRGVREQGLYTRLVQMVRLGEPYLTGLSEESRALLRERRFYRAARGRLARLLAVASPPFAPPLRAKIAVWAQLDPYFKPYDREGPPAP